MNIPDTALARGEVRAVNIDGNMYKRNEFERVDTKGSAPVLASEEHDRRVEVDLS